jgi:Contact-dependent growth inhibition CdiA C-terminal domain
VGVDEPRSGRDECDQSPDRHPQRSDADRPGDNTRRQDGAETRFRQDCRDDLISTCSAELGSSRPWTPAKPAIERSEWQNLLIDGAVDRVGLGVVDERAKKFSPAERRIAEHLAANGAAVVSVSEGFGVSGRTSDSRVDNVPVEFKSLDMGASDRTVKAALNSAKGQARHAVIDARGSGLTEDDANHGLRRFQGTPHGDRLDAVLIVGNDYIIDWKRDD